MVSVFDILPTTTILIQIPMKVRFSCSCLKKSECKRKKRIELANSCWIKVVRNQCDQIGWLLHFGQLFKVYGNNYLAKISHILGHFAKELKSFIFLVKSFLGNFYRHLATFNWSHCLIAPFNAHLSTTWVVHSKPFFSVINSVMPSVTRLGNFWKFLATNALSKVA